MTIQFSEKEIENPVVSEAFFTHKEYRVKFDTPITPRENIRRAYAGDPLWISDRTGMMWFCPEVVPDNVARAFVIEGQRYTGPVGGPDMFGIEWEFVKEAGGSIVRPGNPTLTDVSKWREVIHFPDLDSWDWQGSADRNREFLEKSDKYINFCVFTGWFERLISFMDFGPAAFALMNKKTKPYVKEIMEALTDLWIDLVDHVDRYYGHLVDGFAFHDDWGSQTTPFFNGRIFREMLVPYMKRLTDHCRELGYTTELHSCGKIDRVLDCVCEAGWDGWEGMGINDFPYDYATYGERLIISVSPDAPAEDAPEEEQKAAAREFVERYGDKKHPIFISSYHTMTPVFQTEVYRLSRLKFSE